MSAATKQNIASVIPTVKARNELQTRSIPQPGDYELLVRNHAIAVNPVDWKIQDYTFYVEKYPNVLGSDVAGVVEAVGSKVKHVKVGDRVTEYAGVIWNQNPEEGAFQTYTILRDFATGESHLIKFGLHYRLIAFLCSCLAFVAILSRGSFFSHAGSYCWFSFISQFWLPYRLIIREKVFSSTVHLLE